MFVQKYQNGAIYKNLSTMQYVLKIDDQEYFGNTIKEVLEQYSADQINKVKEK